MNNSHKHNLSTNIPDNQELRIIEEMALQLRRKEQLIERVLSSDKQKYYRAYHNLKNAIVRSSCFSPMQMDDVFRAVDDMCEYTGQLENLLYLRERIESITASKEHLHRLERWRNAYSKDTTLRARVLKLFKRN